MSNDPVVDAVTAVADQEFGFMERGELASLLGLLASDAVFFPPNDSPKTGNAVGPWLQDFMNRAIVHFRHDEVVTHGEWAVLRTSFQWRVVPRSGEEATARRGTTLRMFRRDAAGAWRLAREIWNTYAES